MTREEYKKEMERLAEERFKLAKKSDRNATISLIISICTLLFAIGVLIFNWNK